MQGGPPQILFFAERVNKSAATYQSGPSVLPTITPPGKQSPRRLITLSTHGAPHRPCLAWFFLLLPAQNNRPGYSLQSLSIRALEALFSLLGGRKSSKLGLICGSNG
ncbi:hypothetical protein TNCT_588111 [Trichonephila clavata]|uniref:Uncharacterized protein n=1 Tax=Trichonephila clavata TaxID=2740835 RepID=A0A8X6L8X5_TRICU|nr:hypothetical protein TNCT_588111 [Trichonephila clavata]